MRRGELHRSFEHLVERIVVVGGVVVEEDEVPDTGLRSQADGEVDGRVTPGGLVTELESVYWASCTRTWAPSHSSSTPLSIGVPGADCWWSGTYAIATPSASMRYPRVAPGWRNKRARTLASPIVK